MLSVRNLDQSQLKCFIKEVNSFNEEHEHVYVALIYSPSNVVVAGPPKTLLGLCNLLQQARAPKDLDQSKIPFPRRRPVFRFSFLPVSAPFHTPHLEDACARVLNALNSERLLFCDMGIPLHHTSTGEDIRSNPLDDLLETLVRMVMVDPVDWAPACLPKTFTYLLDFGPGCPSSLLNNLIEGSGVRTIAVCETTSSSGGIGAKNELFAPVMPPKALNWSQTFGPSLISKPDGAILLDTKMSRLLGTPPVMVAGMTPTTVPWDFVTAVMQAGYHVEHAAGGYSNAELLEKAILQISESVPAGRGITCNLIYASPKTFAWQVSLITRLISNGVRIEGMTIGAGIPSVHIATEFIQGIGLKHISFKPGSVESIECVLKIAEANPHFPILIHWTGGRAGGHHSYEDFHEPILKTYARIRQHPNIVLIAGSGFGDACEISRYITGKWSNSFGFPAMPFDGVLLGSRMMVSKEAHTSPQVKRLITETRGCDDVEWHKSYDASIGGVVTVSSEMGQPIHKISNRAVMLWKDFDDRIFSIKAPVERLKKLHASREEIISGLNNDYAKPWFAVNDAGVSVEIEDMTYSECLRRLIRLMYIRSQRRWIDVSYRNLVFAFIIRVRERLICYSPFILDHDSDPLILIDGLLASYPSASTELIYAEDASFLVGLCRLPGQKPVNFIPRLDSNFETWFKKDSLWQMEDLDAVLDEDPQRVCIIHGPVAARHSQTIDEPVASILDGITNSLIEILRPSLQGMIPVRKTDPISAAIATLQNVVVKTGPAYSEYQFSEQGPLPENDAVISHILQSNQGWAHACLTDKYIHRGGRSTQNTVRSAFSPRQGDIIITTRGVTDIETIVLRTKGPDGQFYDVLSLTCLDGLHVRLVLQTPRNPARLSPTLVSEFRFVAQDQSKRLYDDTKGGEDVIKHFYASIWGHGSLPPTRPEIGSEYLGETTTLSYKSVEEFMTVIAQSDAVRPVRESPSKFVPLDISIVICWVALTKPLVTSGIKGDLRRLLHLSNSFEYCSAATPLAVGDVLETLSRVTAVSILPAGKSITVVATIRRNNQPVVKVTSVFLIQGIFGDEEDTFQVVETPEMTLDVKSPKIHSLLQSRHWFTPKVPKDSLLGKTLLFKFQPYTMKSSSCSTEIEITGEAFEVRNGRMCQSIGDLYFAHDACRVNPTVAFLQRHGNAAENIKPLEHPGWLDDASLQVKIPKSLDEYSRVSKDANPIHTSSVFAKYAQLPEIIAHGMYTSAAVRRVIEKAVANADCSRFRKWSTSFDGIVHPGDVIDINIQHMAMLEGRMVFKIQAYLSGTHERVLEADAEIEQAPTSYLFCGQGSQEKGMGLALYNSNPTAKMIWDKGDKFFLETYGFSLLDIVRNDPKSLTIYFGGKRGREIRRKYLSMNRSTIRDGHEMREPILTGLTPETLSYTFSEERGLLFSTQFAQPALTLMEVAELEALKSKGMVQQNSMFAGHSLGEYSALAACTSFMSLENLLDLVFYRGLTMQSAMTRDKFGRTDFSMVAVNPSRIATSFKAESFERIVQQIVAESGLLLEIVNWNIEEQQYVCAGQLQALWILSVVCSALPSLPDSSRSPELILSLVRHNHLISKTLSKPIELERSIATVPLHGIDIPFHSTYLRSGVDAYREYLKEKILETDLVPGELIGKWIPNVVGVPFSTEGEFVERVAEITGSEVLREILGTCS